MNSDLLTETLQHILLKKDVFAEELYSQLFLKLPELKERFDQRFTTEQSRQSVLLISLWLIISGVKKSPSETITKLKMMSEREFVRSISSDVYPLVSEAVLEALKRFLQEKWTPEQEHTWRETLQVVQSALLLAYPVEEQ